MQIPDIFKPILWSYDFEKIDPDKIKKTIIKQAFNYGNFEHWRWIKNFYGKDQIISVLKETPDAIDKRTKALAYLIFNK